MMPNGPGSAIGVEQQTGYVLLKIALFREERT